MFMFVSSLYPPFVRSTVRDLLCCQVINTCECLFFFLSVFFIEKSKWQLTNCEHFLFFYFTVQIGWGVVCTRATVNAHVWINLHAFYIHIKRAVFTWKLFVNLSYHSVSAFISCYVSINFPRDDYTTVRFKKYNSKIAK